MVPMQHITYVERQKLEFLVRCRLGVREIARRLHRDHSVIVRELKRNTEPGSRYTAARAQRLVEQRRQAKRLRKLDCDAQLYWYVRLKLQEDWSPEQIAGRLRREQGHSVISHETIYQYIYTGDGRLHGWYHCLRSGRRRRQPRYQRKARKGTGIPERISIHARPDVINQRTKPGHWESDSMVFSKQKARLSVQYERMLKYTLLQRVENGSAQATLDALRYSIESLPAYLWQSITFDNGKEGTKHTVIRDDYMIDTYFCDPYASWQKGGVENTNRWIRQYLPRHINLADLSEQQLQHIQHRLNSRPRKSLLFQTPHEALHNYLITSGALLT